VLAVFTPGPRNVGLGGVSERRGTEIEFAAFTHFHQFACVRLHQQGTVPIAFGGGQAGVLCPLSTERPEPIKPFLVSLFDAHQLFP